MAQDTLYFPHDYDPLSDPSLKMLVKKHGAMGYGVYWKIVELLHQNADHKLKFSNPIYEQIADSLFVEPVFVETLIEECIQTYFLLESSNGLFWSRRVDKNITKRQLSIKQKSDAGRASAEQRRRDREDAELFRESQRSLTDVDTRQQRKKEIL
jgi:hypothetical protein